MNAIKNKLSTFGRQAFDLYDKYPLLCNSVVGSTVYAAGELVVQHNNRVAAGPSVALVSNAVTPTASSISSPSSFSSSVIDYRRIGQIGLLGGLENGVLMLIWYSTLNFIVGASKATSTVLIKCFLDQVFFAAQQDGVFLALCAYQHKEGLQDAIREVKKTFLTTWLNDCSVWPLVNFLGFAAVPVKIQPTFMSSAQFFWQVYVSSVAAASSEEGKRGSSEADARLAKAFSDIDTDGNGFIDATELKTALNKRGVKDLSTQDVEKMIAEVAKFRVVQPQHEPQNKNVKEGQVSLEDFKAITKLGTKLKYGHLWERVQTEANLQKGLKKSLQRLDQHKTKAAEAAESVSSRVRAIDAEQQKLKTPFNLDNFVSTSKMVLAVLGEKEDTDKYGETWKESREMAIQNSLVGGSALLVVSLVRRLVFKI